MRLTQIILSVFCLLVFIKQASGQGNLKFEKESHDFGNITESVQATYEFKFKNIGDQPVLIANVQPSCGCTTPDWTKDPILPGKSGIVKAVYNSSGRPGAFHKAISVTSNAATATQVLFIKGNVAEKPAVKAEYTPLEKEKSPRLTLSRTTFDFGKLEVNQKATARFSIKNTGKQPLIIQGIKSACNCVNYKLAAAEIAPGKEEILELTYTQRVLGEQKEKVSIISNDIVSASPELFLKANVVQSLNTTSIIKEGSAAVPFK